jgi:hypothetical protein
MQDESRKLYQHLQNLEFIVAETYRDMDSNETSKPVCLHGDVIVITYSCRPYRTSLALFANPLEVENGIAPCIRRDTEAQFE